jgi:hypothetical protein
MSLGRHVGSFLYVHKGSVAGTRAPTAASDQATRARCRARCCGAPPSEPPGGISGHFAASLTDFTAVAPLCQPVRVSLAIGSPGRR